MSEESRFPLTGMTVLGLALVALGVILLIGDFDYGWEWQNLWPLLIVVVGLGTLVGAESTDHRRRGLILVGIGGWFLVNTMGLWGLHFGNSWPLILLAIGTAKILQPGRDGRQGGFWMIGAGLIFLAVTRGLFGLTWATAWPLFLILAGLSIMFRPSCNSCCSWEEREELADDKR